MSTLELTYSMLKDLPETDLLKIRAYIHRVVEKNDVPRESYNPFIGLTREEILEELAISRNRVEQGFVLDAHQASSNVREKYGL